MIRLLDGKEWERKDLLDRMDDDSFYYGYLGEAALSSSSIKSLYESPVKYKSYLAKDNNDVPALREGRLFHMLLLEYGKIPDKYVFVDASSRNTKMFKEAKLDNPGVEVMLHKELRSMSYLVSKIEANYEASQLLRDGLEEMPGIGEINGLPFRGKADYIKTNMIVDVKTTSDLSSWVYSARYKWHYDVQAYIYMQLFNVQKFIFLVIDKSTGEIGIYECSEESLEKGKKKVEIACNNYRKYFYDKTENVNEYVRKGYI
jgi:hypothetical protein|tara:strand:+ start:152 stop:928 length:777 start_codon:yes stop_codon:yes gene_type:complete